MDEKNCMLPLIPVLENVCCAAMRAVQSAVYFHSPRHQLVYYSGNDCIIKWDIEHPMARRVSPFIFAFVVLYSGHYLLSILLYQDAMVVILKSLVPGCLFNIVGFGSTFKSLFTTSQNYEEVKQLCSTQRSVWVNRRNCSVS